MNTQKASSSLQSRLQKTFSKPFWINWLQATIWSIGGMAIFTLLELLIVGLTGQAFGGSLLLGMIYVGLGAYGGLWILNRKRDRRWIYGALFAMAFIAGFYLALPSGTQGYANILLILIPLGAVLGPSIWKK